MEEPSQALKMTTTRDTTLCYSEPRVHNGMGGGGGGGGGNYKDLARTEVLRTCSYRESFK